MSQGFKNIPKKQKQYKKNPKNSGKSHSVSHLKPTPEIWDNGTFYTGAMKMASEEASYQTCWDCGRGGGRHSSRCSQKEAE